LLDTPEANIVAVFFSLEIFVWVYLGMWAIYEYMVYIDDPKLRIGNIPPAEIQID